LKKGGITLFSGKIREILHSRTKEKSFDLREGKSLFPHHEVGRKSGFFSTTMGRGLGKGGKKEEFNRLFFFL